jgi:hypothetical protein
MRDSEQGPTREGALILDEEKAYGTITSSSVNSPIMSVTGRSNSHRCLVPCILIAVVALVTLIAPVSQERLTMLTGGGVYGQMKEALAHTTSTPRMHVDFHSNRFDYTSSWCPNANCTGTPICYPCQRRWLIIVTTGRSASTTLTEMIDRLPGIRMTGENNNLVGRFENLLQDWPQDMIDGTAPAWFHNPIPEESWSCASQTVFTTANPPKLVKSNSSIKNGDGEGEEPLLTLEEGSDEQTILGFKTIRLFDNEIIQHTYNLTEVQIQDIAMNMFEALTRLFPCSRFVVNFRSDVTSQVISWQASFGATNPDEILKRLKLDNDLLHAFHNYSIIQRSFLLDSTQWTRNITTFNEMLDWLGYSKSCHFPAALEYNTQDGYSATKTEVNLSQDCKYLHTI